MTQGVFTGVITRIGAGVVKNGQLTTSSVLEIGDHSLRDISYDNYISTYLTDAIEKGTPVSISVLDGGIIMPSWRGIPFIDALKINGKIYYSDLHKRIVDDSKIHWVAWIFIVVVGLFTFGIGSVLIYLLLKYQLNKMTKILAAAMSELERAKA